MGLKAKEINVDDMSFNEKLGMTMLSFALARDSLSRQLNQDDFMAVEFLMNKLLASLYSCLCLAILKDEETMDKLQIEIQDLLNDIKNIQKHLFATRKH